MKTPIRQVFSCFDPSLFKSWHHMRLLKLASLDDVFCLFQLLIIVSCFSGKVLEEARLAATNQTGNHFYVFCMRVVGRVLRLMAVKIRCKLVACAGECTKMMEMEKVTTEDDGKKKEMPK